MAEPYTVELSDESLKVNDWSINLREMRHGIITWGESNFQEFPWRGEPDPYRILVAEVMLHRTRAAQVVPVYLSFIAAFPTIEHVAESSLSELEEAMRSLGLLWRVRKLLELAQIVSTDFEGTIPDSFDDLVDLPGVSHYIASAVLCFAFEQPLAVVDTNTLRIVARLLGLELTDSSRRSRKMHGLMASILDSDRPQDFNYAMLDLGHLICTPSDPQCHECPLLRTPCRHGLGVVGMAAD